jgi:hypothetical protein
MEKPEKRKQIVGWAGTPNLNWDDTRIGLRCAIQIISRNAKPHIGNRNPAKRQRAEDDGGQ